MAYVTLSQLSNHDHYDYHDHHYDYHDHHDYHDHYDARFNMCVFWWSQLVCASIDLASAPNRNVHDHSPYHSPYSMACPEPWPWP